MKPTMTREDIAKPPRVPLWRNRDYMLLWSGQTVSLVGTVISQTAFPLLVWGLTHSAAQVGLVGGLGTLPYVLLSLLAGALIDRWNRKRVMILCDTGRALNLVSYTAALRLLSDLSGIDHSQSACSSCTFTVRGTIRLKTCPKEQHCNWFFVRGRISREVLPLACMES